MTTFIDFRYARTLSSALLGSHHPESPTVYFDLSKDNYIAFEFTFFPHVRKLFDLVNMENIVIASVQINVDRSLSFQITNGYTILKTPDGSIQGEKKHIFAFRLSLGIVGLKLHQDVYEENILSLFGVNKKLLLQFDNHDSWIRIIGFDSERDQQWAELYYHRTEPRGPKVELVLDWHHLRSGIPLAAMLMAEKLIEHSNFRFNFHSYVLDKKEAQDTDFSKLFSTHFHGDPDISLHITPPIYTRFKHKSANVGLFVYESSDMPPAIVTRCNLMDSLIVPSTFASNVFKREGVHRPIYVVPHGIDLNFYRPVTEKQLLPGGRGFNFLAVSTYVQRKNVRQLVRAFLEEFRKNEDIALFLLLRPEFGATQNNVALEFDDWEKRYYRKSAPIFFSTGYVTRKTLRDLYANADTYVMPSNEGFGLTLLEAMASGTPVIALRYGGVLDFINDENGYLVPKGRAFISKDRDVISYIGDCFFEPNIKKLRAIMRHVFENREETYEKGLQGRRDCEKHYTWDQTAKEIAHILEETHARRHKNYISLSKTNETKPNQIPFSLVLCVPDDMPATKSIRYLQKTKFEDAEILCLFTRYARFRDIIFARKSGFLFHRWDGSYANCRATIQSIVLTPWASILYPGERIEGDLEDIVAFLNSQPREISEVIVKCLNGIYEPRFVRSKPLRSSIERGIFNKISIC